MTKDLPLFVLALTVSLYWATVLLLVAYKRLRHGQSAGVVPRQRFERRLWRAMLPVVGSWIALPLLLTVPAWAQENSAVLDVRGVAAGVAVGCYLVSLYSWLLLGRNWSMAVVPGQATTLVTGGIYRWVRHPIYAASVLLMLSSAVVLPVLPMVLLAVAHLIVMILKARNEERYLTERFGPSYTAYCREVGRFFPRLPARRSA